MNSQLNEPTSPLKSDRMNVSGEALCCARTSVGEYARAAGMRDPEVILTFARQCVDRAVVQLKDRPSGDTAELLDTSLRIAASRVGIRDDGMATGIPAAVPAANPRNMPRQSLGELPKVDRSIATNSAVQGVWQSLLSGLTRTYEALIVRSK